MILPSQRHLFDIPRDVCYLNAAYMTPLTKAQQEIGAVSAAQNGRPWEVFPEDFNPTSDKIRNHAASMFNVRADDIAIIPSVSYGIATAGKNLIIEAGSNVLVIEDQFPSNIYEWQENAKAAGGAIVTVPTPEDHDWTSAILEALDHPGAAYSIVALPQVHWSSGALIDLVKVSKACRKLGAALVLDLTQSAGAMPTDIAEIDPDFAVFGTYKWLMGPYSLCFMYVAPRQQEGQPLEQNWLARKDSEDFAGLVNYQDSYQPGARRFDMGERSNFILSPICVEGLRQLQEWGVGNIADTLQAINTRLCETAAECGFNAVPDQFRSPHMLGLYVGSKGRDLLASLKDAGVFASLRGEMLRVAPHLWIDDHDMDVFEVAMRSV
ncbi:MAG: aminotransferase class V-fold PLP-dependent enzyme [Kordiimonadaceae bacterium]|nr:aminotransferase class V-fold PLP-dependent enzyme [Kordiimonadaceae bacterium]